MFATASISSKNISAKVVLIYDTDPESPSAFPDDCSLPDSVRLRRDLDRYRLGSLPQVTIIGPCTPTKPPAVLTGRLGMKDGELILKSTAGTWKIDVGSWDTENRNMRKVTTTPGKLTKGLVVGGKNNRDTKVVSVDLSGKCHPESRLSVCREWIAGLALRHHTTTAHLILHLVCTNQRASETRSCDGTEENTSDISSMFWLWFPSPKPRNLRSWLKFLWARTVSKEEYEEIRNILHPIQAGFYKTAIRRWARSGSQETSHQAIFWEDGSVKFLEVSESDEISGSLEMRIDMKVCAPTDSHTGFSDWGFGSRTQAVDVFFLRNRKKLPECFGPVRSDFYAPNAGKLWNGDVKKYPDCNISMRRRMFQRSCELESRFLPNTASTPTSSYTNISQETRSSTTKRRRLN